MDLRFTRPKGVGALTGLPRRGSVRTEVLAGMLPKEEKQTPAFLAEIGWLDVDQALADLAGDMARQHVKSHPGVDTVDYLVAASVEALEAELATTNLKHFPMFSELKKPY